MEEYVIEQCTTQIEKIAQIAENLQDENSLLKLILFLTYFCIVFPLLSLLIANLIILASKKKSIDNNQTKKVIKHSGKIDKDKRF